MKTLWLLGSHSIIFAKTGMTQCVISVLNFVDKQESVNVLSHALTAIINYTDTIVRDVLARGIADPDIKPDLLGDKNQNMTLEEVT